ncbi:MAG: efflux RND transporter permease subunit [Bacteroidia bacterium]|nr:efflux RND transporter permease subunit [Bacteroidia bacterium]
MLKIFIERPVLATVISILLVLLGGLGLATLPITQFPDIAPPVVLVTANYPGANAETVIRSVAPSLEESINGVENMTYMSSSAGNDGSLNISVYFELGTDPDQAAVNVQNRVAQASNQLPAEVLQMGVSTTKQQNSIMMFVNLYSTDAKKYDHAFIENYAKINVIPEIKRVKGVAQAMAFGSPKDYSMRIWLNPPQMASYNITPQEVMAAIQDQNMDAAPGRFGEGSDETFEYIIKYKGKMNRPEEYENMIIRANPDGSLLKLKDVARIELGSFTYSGESFVNGQPTVGIAIFQTAGSNANEIQTALTALLKKQEASFPAGIEYIVPYSTKRALDQSIDQVKSTLMEAFVLVFIVVLIFLQDFRSTLIPAIAVPVAVIGTFFFMQLFGFSINLLTLFALVLAIGIVVDDAIVVVEAVHAKMENEHMDAKTATLSAMSEITGAIISITLVMSAVFLPVGFMTGSSGVFYRQFAFTLAIAILISAVNALTLSPALSALFLKNTHGAQKGEKSLRQSMVKRLGGGFNKGFDALTTRYGRSLQFLIRNKWVSLGGLALIIVATVLLMRSTRTGFIPAEDQSFAIFALSTPGGSSLDRTNGVLQEAGKMMREMEAVQSVNLIGGFNLLSNSASPSSGVGFVELKPMGTRGETEDLNELMATIQGKLNTIQGGSFFVFTFPTVPGFSNIDGLDMVLQDRSGGPVDKFSGVANGFIGSLMARPEVAVAFTPFRADYPQLELSIDAAKAKQLGVSVRAALTTMQAYFGSMQASDFNRFGKYYRVMVQADIPYRADPSALNGVYVKNMLGENVPLNTLVQLKRVYGPENMTRYNLFNSIGVNVIPKPGFSTGDAIKAVEEVAKTDLPQGYTYEFSGITREEISSGGQSTYIFALCLIFVYFLLAAQYESYILPLSVILSIPTGLLGVFIAIGIAGIENNIYVQVALIMLIGLLAKNAILIVEYAVQRRRSGMRITEAALEAARLRLRPIVMTSLAFIVGLLPMMGAKGPSALGNHSISIGAVGGMLSGVVLGIFIIPVLFVVFQHLHEKISKKAVPVPAATH